MRIGGLASGMDINQIVSDLMRAERMPLDKLKQKKQVLEWQRDDYRAINTLLLDFRTELTQMKLTTQYRARTTSSTNDSYVTATASSAAGQSSYSISKVTQLATAETQKNGGSIIADGKSFDATIGLYSQEEAFRYKGNGVWKEGFVQSEQVTANGETKTIEMGLSNVKTDALGSWSVTVNGVGYKVVTGKAQADLEGNEVLVGSDGKSLTFKENVAKDSVIRVGYIAEKKTEKFTLSTNTTRLKLSYGTLEDISLKWKGENLTIQGEGTKKSIYRGGTEVGTIDTTEGTINFTDPSIFPTEGSKETFSLEITYKSTDAKYTSMSMSTHTSKGERYESFLIDGKDSLNSVINRVNNSILGVTMFYDDVTKQMTITRNETGDFNESGKEIIITDDIQNSFLRDVLRFRGATETQAAQNAKFEINGLETNRSSNTFTMNGTTFTLKQTFDSTAADSTVGPVTVNVNSDGNQIFDNIKAFVTKYNELIDKIQKKMNEERFRSYLPLTDDERETLSDKQQEQWEEKAKSGLLRRDPMLSSVLTNMRMNFSQPVANDGVSSLFNQLAKLGITTSANYLEGGKLEINEAKLKQAIEEDPQSVENFFRGTGATDAQNGVIHRLYDSVNAAMDKLKERAGNSFSVSHQFALGREMKSFDDRIDSFERRLKLVEDRYWKQFTMMEKAIQRSNEQMMYLMQQFSM